MTEVSNSTPTPRTFAFIDASNLFYGGEKSLGWKIDYKKLIMYLREKYATMKELDNFNCALVLSGDGDFLPVLKYIREYGKEVIILARGPRTAKEIRQFAGPRFRDFTRLERALRFDEDAKK